MAVKLKELKEQPLLNPAADSSDLWRIITEKDKGLILKQLESLRQGPIPMEKEGTAKMPPLKKFAK